MHRYVVLVLALAVTICGIAAASEENLSYMTNSGKPVKVFIASFTNESGQGQIMPEAFKKAFETAVAKRGGGRSFEITSDPASSQVQISAIIKKYLYSKTDPITSFASPSAVALDAMTTENYVTMDVEFTVVDSKTSKVLWQKKTSDFVKHTMTPEESIPMIYDKVSRTFLWKCFGRPK